MKKKVLFKAPVLTRSGYGEQSRFALRALMDRQDLFDIYVQPLQWGQTSWINDSSIDRSWLDNTIEKTIAYIQQGGQFDISFQVTIPNEWERLAPVNIGYTAGIETNKVAHQWLLKGNEMNKIVVVSNHAKRVFEETAYIGVDENTQQQVKLQIETPIVTVNYPAKKFENLPEIDIDFKNDINFLVVAQFGPRKNLVNTLKWFVEEFHDDEVGLILKTNLAKNCLMDRENVKNQLKQFVEEYPDKKCTVYLLHGDMEDDEMHSLYSHEKVSALISLAHGEGFGLPIFEAAYTGLPVVCTGWSGQLDFLVDEEGKDRFYNVAFDMQPIPDEVFWDGVLIKESMWSYAREQSAKNRMRECYDDLKNQKEDSVALDASRFGDSVQERFAQQKQYDLMVSTLLEYVQTADESEWRDVLDQVVEYD